MDTATVNSTAYCLPVNTTEAGTASTCNCFTQVSGYQNNSGKSQSVYDLSASKLLSADFQSGYDCEELASDFSITLSQLTTWNTWLGSNCDTALYAGLDADHTRAICIGVNASAPTGPASAIPSPISSQTDIIPATSIGPPTGTSIVPTGSVTSPASPTQSGIASNCDEHYTVASGDSCSKVETQFRITFAELYQWNPAIGSDCENLWVGYAVCVAISS